jgi:hypothetical protein
MGFVMGLWAFIGAGFFYLGLELKWVGWDTINLMGCCSIIVSACLVIQ